MANINSCFPNSVLCKGFHIYRYNTSVASDCGALVPSALITSPKDWKTHALIEEERSKGCANVQSSSESDIEIPGPESPMGPC